MKVVAIYNMKGGVGKTTTAVNLSYLAAATGRRVLVWDLDPQAAASFAFRVRPRVDGFGGKHFPSAETFVEAIRETDYANLHLLPADFAYRKLDRLLDEAGKPRRVVRTLIDTLGRDYDLVFLDCPAGFTLVTEGIFAAADAVLVPTVPTVLSLRTLARLMKWADRSESRARLAAFFSMVDRRKTLHRQAVDWSRDYPDVFLAGLVPYASVVEQMSLRRMPLAAFAPRDAATAAFHSIWTECESRLLADTDDAGDERNTWEDRRRAVEALMTRLESPRTDKSSVTAEPYVIHQFDTAGRDLHRRGQLLELHERQGGWLLVLARHGDSARRLQAQVDRSWAFDILSGAMSPLAALEQRLGRPGPDQLDLVRTILGDQDLRRVDSRMAEPAAGDPHATTIRQAV